MVTSPRLLIRGRGGLGDGGFERRKKKPLRWGRGKEFGLRLPREALGASLIGVVRLLTFVPQARGEFEAIAGVIAFQSVPLD